MISLTSREAVRAKDLPPTFRMRHASHYVEQLMGDGPIQSVRQIPIDQVIGPDVTADVSDLAASIREVGLLQPLLVTSRESSRFELLPDVTGCRRRAGRPCCCSLSARERRG